MQPLPDNKTPQPVRNYRVAPLFLPTQDAENFTDFEEAEARAVANSVDDDVWGIWDLDASHLEAIAYQGNLYTS